VRTLGDVFALDFHGAESANQTSGIENIAVYLYLVRISANVNTDFGHREHLPNEIGVGG
jgi:hypothetical protein